ncbi:MAG: hypothetical protein R3264_09130, partial [Anaerolineae bacterium]|nr:hypothetical protein [Anaerolineae bacterium]
PTVIFSLLGLLLFLDLASFDRSLMRFLTVEAATAPGRAAAAYLAEKPGRFRVYSPSYSLPVQTAALAGIALADGVEPVHLSAYDHFMAQAGGYNDPGFSVTIPNFADKPLDSALAKVEPDLRLLGLLNVEYLATAFPLPWPGLTLEQEIDGTFIYRNERALPPAWLVYEAVPAGSDWLSQLATLSLDRVVAVEDNFTGAISRDPAQAKGQVRLVAAEANRLTLAVTDIPETGAWLVLSELWYPGWQATVAGKPQPVLRVNGLLRGVRLDTAGSYEVKLSYRPRSVIWGGRISMATLALILLATGWVWFRREN